MLREVSVFASKARKPMRSSNRGESRRHDDMSLAEQKYTVSQGSGNSTTMVGCKAGSQRVQGDGKQDQRVE
jgi:hypothetical protein